LQIFVNYQKQVTCSEMVLGKTQKPVFLEEYSCYMGYSNKVID